MHLGPILALILTLIATFFLSSTNIAYAPYDALEQSFSNACVHSLGISNYAGKPFDDCSLSQDKVSKVQAFSAGICDKPDRLINHLKIVAL